MRIVSAESPSINLFDFSNCQVQLTLRSGSHVVGPLVHYRGDNFQFTPTSKQGRRLFFKENGRHVTSGNYDCDIVQIKLLWCLSADTRTEPLEHPPEEEELNLHDRVNLYDFDGRQVLVTVRNGKTIRGDLTMFPDPGSGDQFKLTPHGFLNGWFYHPNGDLQYQRENERDIVSICLLGEVKHTGSRYAPVDKRSKTSPFQGDNICKEIMMPEPQSNNKNFEESIRDHFVEEMERRLTFVKEGKDTAPQVEKMALSLLPAVFTFVEDDSDLKEALRESIASALHDMFGNDIQGNTLASMVGTIQSRIFLSAK